MTIEKWVDQDEPSCERDPNKDPYVLLQVLQIMPLRMNSFGDADKVLHELVVVAWSCAERISPCNPFTTRFKATKRPEEQFFIVLNKWVSMSLVHTFRKEHVGLAFTREMYLKMLANSRELGRKLQEEVEWGLVVTLGRTIHEVSTNLNEFHRAKALLRRVLDLVTVAYVTIREETTIESLEGVGMYFTDTLEGIKPPPSPTPEYDD